MEPFFPPGTPTLTWEATNPLAYFNLVAFAAGILLLRHLARRRGDSSLADGAWWSGLVLTVGSGLHLLGDATGVSEEWDHQFIHFALMLSVLAFWWFARRGD